MMKMSNILNALEVAAVSNVKCIEYAVISLMNNEIFLGESTTYDKLSDEDKTAIIESILINIPLSTTYIAQALPHYDDYVLLNNKNLFFTLRDFIKNRTLNLTGLKYLTYLEGLNYDDLARPTQRRIISAPLPICFFFKGINSEIVEDIKSKIILLKD